MHFECSYEIHTLKTFQNEGHFVPALRERNALGEATMQPRKWKGNQVHALTLCDGAGVQLLRALSDSREDAERLLGDQLRQSFYGAQRSLAIVEFSRVLGIAEAAVAEYQQAEKSPALKARIDSMLAGRL